MDTETQARGPARLWHREYVLALLVAVGTGLSFNAILPVLPLYVAGVGAEEWQVGAVVGAYGVTSILLRLLGGRITEQRGYRNVLFLGSALFGVTAIAFGLTDSIALLFGLRLLQGIAMVAFFVATATMVAQVSPIERMGEAVAYFSVTFGLAQALGPPVAVAIVDEAGFLAAFIACGLASFLSLVFVLAARRPQLRPRSAAEGHPPLVNRGAFFPASVWLSVTLTMGPVFAFLPLFALERQMGNPGLWYGVMGVVGMLARLPLGRLSDRYGRGIIVIPGLMGTGLSMIVLSISTEPVLFLASAVLYGAATAGGQVGLLTMAIERASMETRGSAVATFQWAWDIGSSAGAMGLGLLAGAVGYAAVFVIVGATPLLGLGGFLLGRRRLGSG